MRRKKRQRADKEYKLRQAQGLERKHRDDEARAGLSTTQERRTRHVEGKMSAGAVLRSAGIVGVLLAQVAFALSSIAMVFASPLLQPDLSNIGQLACIAGMALLVWGGRLATGLAAGRQELLTMRRCTRTSYALSFALAAFVTLAMGAIMSDGFLTELSRGPMAFANALLFALVIFAPLLAFVAACMASSAVWGVFYAMQLAKVTGDERDSQGLAVPFLGAVRFFKRF